MWKSLKRAAKKYIFTARKSPRKTTAAIGISTAPATPSFGKQNIRQSQRRFIQSAALFPYSRKNKAVCTDGFFPLPNPTARLRLSVGRQTNNAKNRRQKLFKNFCRSRQRLGKTEPLPFKRKRTNSVLKNRPAFFANQSDARAKSVLDELPLPTNRLLKNHQDMPLTTPPYSPVFSI